MKTPFFDPHKSYEDNYDQGPFGAFADNETYENKGEPQYEFCGIKVSSPFGIPAGPLLNGKYMTAAFKKGFDIPVYKTVRGVPHQSHPFPNVIPVDVEGDLTFEHAQSTPLVGKKEYTEPLSITNSFAVPSKDKEVWQKDFKQSAATAGNGQVAVLSFMGTAPKDGTQLDFINDNIETARAAATTGAKILEINLSCPNFGAEGLICYDLETTEAICKGVREAIGDTPLILKVGYYQDQSQLEQLAQIADKYAHAIASINTIQATVVDEDGNQALPGSPVRLKSGICGASVKWAGIEMAKRFKEVREKNNYNYEIVGIGGVMNVQDFHDYRDAGADVVMSATGAMWDPHLAIEIKKSL